MATSQRNGLAKAMRAKGISRTELAVQCGVAYPTVYSWERGYARPNGAARILLSRALGLELTTVNGWFDREYDNAAA